MLVALKKQKLKNSFSNLEPIPKTPQRSWYDFYKDRDPERYLRYAQRRYEPFIAVIQAFIKPGSLVMEVGCGMGTISRALYLNGAPAKQFILVDRDPAMVGMAAWNTRYFEESRIRLFDCDAFALLTDTRIGPVDLIHGHGFLEHFSDKEIEQLIYVQKHIARCVIHYVPGEKYATPSFGDERLMSIDEWKKIAKPDVAVPFNDGFDYILIWFRREIPTA